MSTECPKDAHHNPIATRKAPEEPGAVPIENKWAVDRTCDVKLPWLLPAQSVREGQYAFFASSFCILMAAELYPVIKGRPELYITARIFTLAFHILARATNPEMFEVMDSSDWANQSVVYYWGLINLVLHVPFVVWYFKTKKENPTGEPPCGDNQPLISEYAGTELNPTPAKTANA